MRALAKEAIEVGALGFASSRLTIHKTESGSPIPSYDAAREEIEEIARGVVDGGGGLLQFVPDIPAGGYQPVLQTVFDVAEDVGLPVTFTLVVANAGDPTWPDAITMIEKANARRRRYHRAAAAAPDRADHRAAADRQPVRALPQLPRDRAPAAGRARRRDAQARGPRPHPGRQARPRSPDPVRRPDVGLDLPAGRQPRLRARPVDQHRGPGPGPRAWTRWRRPTTGCSTTTAAPCCWSPPATWRATRWTPSASCCTATTWCSGLGDGGAHYGMICDASYSTYFLAHWARDRNVRTVHGARSGPRTHLRARRASPGWPTAAASPSDTRPTSTSSTTPRCACTSR